MEFQRCRFEGGRTALENVKIAQVKIKLDVGYFGEINTELIELIDCEVIGHRKFLGVSPK